MHSQHGRARVCEKAEVPLAVLGGLHQIVAREAIRRASRARELRVRVPDGKVVLNDAVNTKDYVVCGHCCESGDVFTVDDSDTILPRTVNEANIGDLVVIEGAGAYCAAMSLKNYNSFPTTPQLLLDNDGTFKTILGEETLEAMFTKEIIPDFA